MIRDRRPSALANDCATITAIWIDGDRRDALAAISKPGRPHKRRIALAVGVMHWLQAYRGYDAAAEFANAITEPHGGHY